MKKKMLISLFFSFSLITIIVAFVTLCKPVVAENSDFSFVDMKKPKQDEVEMNPTISQAIECVKQDPEFWDSEDEFEDSTTILAVDDGFLKGEMEDSKTGIIFNSDTDPDVATLGEVRKDVSEYRN